MKRLKPLAWLACVTCLCRFSEVGAEETAIVKDGRINVRGQPSLAGEVITQLQKGEKVVILEEISLTKAKTNEPPKWARIQMPPKTPVWVYAPFLDLANKTVKVSRLNLRAGPGENYSVVGRLERGAQVVEIRRVEDWLEIETPPAAYAFVAMDLLTKAGAGAASAPAEPARPAVPTTTPTPTTTSDLAKSTPAPVVTVPPPTEAPAVPSTPITAAPVEPKPATPSEPVAAVPMAPATTTVVTLPQNIVLPEVKTEATPPRRVVRREGLVRSTVSIQAPTYYELLSPENRKTINYLHADKLDLNLKDYRGRKIIVTGEEAIDPRWPKTPVIEVETLELIP